MNIVRVIVTDKSPYHKKNEVIELDEKLADKFIKKGWGVLENDKTEQAESEIEVKSSKEKTKGK